MKLTIYFKSGNSRVISPAHDFEISDGLMTIVSQDETHFVNLDEVSEIIREN